MTIINRSSFNDFRCDCTERPCRHSSSAVVSRRRPQGSFSLPVSSAPVLPSSSCGRQRACAKSSKSSCECPDGPCPNTGSDGGCECEARPCVHTIKSRRSRATCECTVQPCSHQKSSEGRIKRVKYRVRRAGCAMARCTAELAMLKLHWELATECAPCKPRALTRRLCRRQQSDNELYRSNSFKFERFERTKDDCSSPIRKPVSTCMRFRGVIGLSRSTRMRVGNIGSAVRFDPFPKTATLPGPLGESPRES